MVSTPRQLHRDTLQVREPRSESDRGKQAGGHVVLGERRDVEKHLAEVRRGHDRMRSEIVRRGLDDLGGVPLLEIFGAPEVDAEAEDGLQGGGGHGACGPVVAAVELESVVFVEERDSFGVELCVWTKSDEERGRGAGPGECVAVVVDHLADFWWKCSKTESGKGGGRGHVGK
jgi:hypothetical protein